MPYDGKNELEESLSVEEKTELKEMLAVAEQGVTSF